MLDNDPIRGTPVDVHTGLNEDEFRKAIGPARRGYLVRRVTGLPHVDDPNDLFDVEINGQTFRIRRRDLDRAR